MADKIPAWPTKRSPTWYGTSGLKLLSARYALVASDIFYLYRFRSRTSERTMDTTDTNVSTVQSVNMPAPILECAIPSRWKWAVRLLVCHHGILACICESRGYDYNGNEGKLTVAARNSGRKLQERIDNFRLRLEYYEKVILLSMTLCI
jgi:hypothetical protein